MNRVGQSLGDVIIDLGVLVWVSVAVGPWWVGVGLFLVGWLANVAFERWCE